MKVKRPPRPHSRDLIFPKAFSPDALDRIIRGTRHAFQKRVVICGLVRDLEEILPVNLQRLKAMGEMFADYQIVIYENDSVDDSLGILQRHAEKNSRFHVISDSLGDPPNLPIRCLDRVERMARYRNRYREYVAQNFSDYDYVIVIDMDLPGGWDINGLFHSLGHEDWDFIGSYGLIRKCGILRQRVLQYDAWAFREYGSFEPKTTYEINYLHWEGEQGLIPVNSCFGGFGIYRMEAMLNCVYEGGDCEHVSFHRQMQEQGMDRLFLNTFQRTDYGFRDSRLLRLLRRGIAKAALTLSRRPEPAPEISSPVIWNLALHPMAMEEQVTMQNHAPSRRAA